MLAWCPELASGYTDALAKVIFDLPGMDVRLCLHCQIS